MHGTNCLILCPAEMYRLLGIALNEDWYITGEQQPRVDVVGVDQQGNSGPFKVTIKPADPVKPQVLVNRPPPPHDNAPEHEARHA